MRTEIPFDEEWLARCAESLHHGEVLVGGQALVFWARHYGLSLACGPAMTLDADFLGGLDTIRDLAGHLNGRATFPSSGGFGSLLCGQVEVPIDRDRFLSIDVLRQVYGLKNGRVRDRAIHCSVLGRDMVVLHPIDVLVSKLTNLARLPEKQNMDGVTQAKLAVDVARSFILEFIGRNERDAIRFINYVFRFGKSSIGISVRRFGVDPFLMIDNIRLKNSSFMDIQYPWMLDEISKMRDLHPVVKPGNVCAPCEESLSGPCT